MNETCDCTIRHNAHGTEGRIMSHYCGYFSNPLDKTPSFDPGIDSVPCPVCGFGLDRNNLKTISVADMGLSVSKFYRTHKSCYDALTDEQKSALDCSVTGVTL